MTAFVAKISVYMPKPDVTNFKNMLCLEFAKSVLNTHFPGFSAYVTSQILVPFWGVIILKYSLWKNLRTSRRDKEGPGEFLYLSEMQGFIWGLALIKKGESTGHQEVISGKGSGESRAADGGWFHRLEQVLWCADNPGLSGHRLRKDANATWYK